MIRLSRHFVNNWKMRVGGDPDPAEITRMLADSIRVQPCRNLQRLNGELYRQLAIYWIPERDIIIKVDDFYGTAVTVMTGNGRK